MNDAIIRPSIFLRYDAIRAAISTATGNGSRSLFGMNLSYHVGDDPKLVRANRQRFFRAAGITEDSLALPGQVHSSTVRTVDAPGLYPESDALITARAGLAVGVTVADCVPILLYAPDRGAIAAVHAGWRGTAARITAGVVESMMREFDIEPAVLVAYIGHAAGFCCYEVGADAARWISPRSQRVRNGKIFVDLKSENRLQLIDAGVSAANIELSDACTICSSWLHSYRRDRERSGRMMAVIGRTKTEGD